MNQSVKNTFIDLLTPTLLVVMAVFLRPFIPALEIAQTDIFVYLPLLLLVISLLISWKFSQITPFFLSLIFIISYIGILEIHSAFFIPVLAILIPLNLLILILFQTKSIFCTAGVFRLFLIAAQSYGIFWVIHNQFSPILNFIDLNLITLHIWPSTFFPIITNMPQIALLLFTLLLLIQIGFIIIRQSPFDSALLGAFFITFIAFFFGNEAFIFFICFSAVAIMLVLATVQASYNMAFIDTLTSLPSRRAMENELKKLGKRYSIAMLDIDHFKNLNDTYGHDVGDQVLRMVAKHIRRVGGGGRPARYGGEEFAVIFPNRTLIDAIPFLEIVRANIENASFALRDKNRPKKIPDTRRKIKPPSTEISVTISIGVAEKRRTDKTPLDVFKLADEALYKAKKQSRNRLCH